MTRKAYKKNELSVACGRALVARGKTAKSRTDLSRPVSLALADGLFAGGVDFFDYGCGRGSDVLGLQALGIAASGWDPVHFARQPRNAAGVVNLGYVANVIEDPKERARALVDAWTLARRVLVVAARLDWEPSAGAGRAHGDGILTALGTFQRYFSQEQLRAWINETLGAQSVAAAPGVFYVFRDETAQQSFTAQRFVHRRAPVRVSQAALLESRKDVLQPLIEFLERNGRVPEADELENVTEIGAAFGNIDRAYRFLTRTLGTSSWEGAALERQRDLLVYVALSRFGRRPKLSNLTSELQRDIKAFFGSYSTACRIADELLFAAGQPAAVNAECSASTIGKLTPDALYVHISALGDLSPLLRVYEGCARTLVGSVDGVTVIKLKRLAPKVSYLVYPDFDSDGHPKLAETFVADLPRLRTYHRDYRESSNPPVLHRKETFVSEAHPFRIHFQHLTLAEEAAGLLQEPESIGFSQQWTARLAARGYRVAGHDLVRL